MVPRALCWLLALMSLREEETVVSTNTCTDVSFQLLMKSAVSFGAFLSKWELLHPAEVIK